MKIRAITICQPYAHLIALPETHKWHKRVENRDWDTKVRGTIAIHAGKSKSWLAQTIEGNYGFSIYDMQFGAIVAIADLVDCIPSFGLGSPVGKVRRDKYPWLEHHVHVSGPWCQIYQNVRPLPKPIPWAGKQRFFWVEIPDEVVR